MRGKIPITVRYKNYKSTSQINKLVIPVHKREAAVVTLKKKISENNIKGEEEIQITYDKIEEAIRDTLDMVGKKRARKKPKNKLRIKTKQLIEERTELKQKKNKSLVDRINLNQLKKLIKK